MNEKTTEKPDELRADELRAVSGGIRLGINRGGGKLLDESLDSSRVFGGANLSGFPSPGLGGDTNDPTAALVSMGREREDG